MNYWIAAACLTAAIFAVTATRGRLATWRFVGRVARRRLFAAICVGALALSVGSVETILRGSPAPYVHDEFAHLLAARTFMHGRLTNPTPAMWEHLETIHELMRPTYMSKYPPAQGLALALGMIAGWPLLGSVGAVAIACMATYWMLLGWMSPRWSFIGGLLAATHPAIFDCGQGYWTGGVGMLGGALLGGVTTRICSRPGNIRAWHGAIVGIAIAMLVNHRPFEGTVSVFLSGIAIFLFATRCAALRIAIGKLAFPVAAILLPTFLWMGYYNWRVTGSATTLPYTAYEQQYAVAPLLYWQRPRPIPAYRHEDMRELEVDSLDAIWLRLGTLQGLLAGLETQIALIFSQCFNPWLLAVPVVTAAVLKNNATRRRYLLVAVVISAGSLVVHLLSAYMLAFHYLQSAAPMFIAWIVLAIRQVCILRFRGWMIGGALAAAVFAAQVEVLGETIAGHVQRQNALGETRQHLIEQLDNLPGRQLVLVRYTPGSQLRTFFEWVYNDPDPDRAKIVWARSMGAEKDRELFKYYHDRRAWMLDVDGPHLSFRQMTNW